jgi:hypothetical protein
MTNSMLEYTRTRIHWHHAALLKVTSDLTPEQFSWRPGPQAPPIGWHLWHIARWADRVQLAFPTHGEPERRQIWEEEGLAERWGLDSSTLGILQAGEGMGHEAAAGIPEQIGQENILHYAERCFARFHEAMDRLTPEDIEWVRPNTQPYRVTEGRQLVSAPAAETPLASDLAYQLTHAARHLGMIEALRGVQKMHGTASA